MRCSAGFGAAEAEDCGSHANAGAALFDGYGEVVRHTHGELREAGKAGDGLVAETAKLAEVGAGWLRVFGPRRDSHQADGGDGGQVFDGGEEGGKLVGREAVLGFFVAEFDLDEDGKGFADGLGCRA